MIKNNKKQTQKSEGTHSVDWLVIGDGNTISVYNDAYTELTPLTEIEPHTATRNKPEES